MARATFGGGIADFVTQSIGGGIVKFAPATLSFYSAKTGGTRYSDLLVGGSAASSISVGTDGQVPQFQGPDGVFTMWADGGGSRVQMVAVADAVALATGPSDSATATNISTPGTATAAALAASYVPKWKGSTAYTAGDTVIAPDGSPVKAKATFTSGTTYNPANWTSVAATSGTQAATELAASIATTAAPVADARIQAHRYDAGIFRGLPPVADGAGSSSVSDLSNGTNTNGYARTVHKVLIDSQDFRLVYANITLGLSGVSPITVSAAVEPVATTATVTTAAATLYPVAFGGQSSVTIAPDGIAISDPIPISALRNYYLYVRTAVQVTSGAKWRISRVTNGVEGNVNGTTPTPAYMATSAPTSIPTSFSNVYCPFGIIGVPKFTNGAPASDFKTWLGLGDSIAAGVGDRAGDDGFFRRAVRALAGKHTFIASPVAGEITPGLLASPSRMQFLTSRWDYVFYEYGNNECSAFNLADAQAQLISGWRAVADRGHRAFINTILPRSTTTDGWTTAAGQTTTAAHETTRAPLNAWIRDGAPINATTFAPVAVGGSGVRMGAVGHPLIGYVEMADVVESARNSGLWKPKQGRSFTASTTVGGGVVSSSDAAFTSGDVGKAVYVPGASFSGSSVSTITNVRNATQVDVFPPAGAATTNVAAAFDPLTSDGIHPSASGYQLMRDALATFMATLP